MQLVFELNPPPPGEAAVKALEDTFGVVFFDHENEPEDPNIPWRDFPNLQRIADSFGELLVKLENGES